MTLITLKFIAFGLMVFVVDLAISMGLLDNDDPFTFRIATIRKRYNTIYQCSKCKKLSREYQMRIYKEVNGEDRCPHCERYMYREKIKEEKWMNSHPDCPRITFSDCVGITNTIKKIKENNKQIKSQQFYEEYNKIKVDFNWIENLQKKHK